MTQDSRPPESETLDGDASGVEHETSAPHANTPSGEQPPSPGRRTWVRRLALIGPAFIAGAWQFGPGALTTAVQAGSQYGYALIWVVVISTLLAIAFTDMSVRIALISEGSIVQTVKDTLGRAVGVASGIGVFFITLMFSVGNAVGSGLSLALLFGGSPIIWTLVCTAAVVGIVWARNLYKVLERLLLALVALMTVGFVLSAFLVRPSWTEVGAGFLPSIPEGTGLLLVALIGTNFSLNAAFFIGYATRERGLVRSQYRDITLSDTIPGIAAPGVLAIFIVVAAAAVANQTGTQISTFPELAQVLEPAAGSAAAFIFGVGFFGAAFSSMTANATAGGTLLADGVGWGNRLRSRRVKSLIMLPLAFGATVTVVAGGSPIELIIIAQALTVLVAPLLGILLFTLTSNRRLMGDLVNRRWQNAVGVIGVVAILATSYNLIVNTLL